MTWLRKHFGAALVLATIGGGLIGGWIGAWSTCGSSCGFDTALFEAWGTWFGAIAAALALGYTAIQVTAELDERRRARRVAVATLESVAMMCRLHLEPESLSNGDYSHIRAEFTNKTSEPIKDIVVSIDGNELDTAALVAPGAQPWGFKLPLSDFGLSGRFLSESNASEVINRDVYPRVDFDFSVGGLRFTRRGARVRLLHT
jgi:hypothetical protein